MDKANKGSRRYVVPLDETSCSFLVEPGFRELIKGSKVHDCPCTDPVKRERIKIKQSRITVDIFLKNEPCGGVL